MKAPTRRAIAYIAGRLLTGRDASSVFDVETADMFMFSGTVSATDINVFDVDRGGFVIGSPTSGEFSLCDLDDSSFLTLRIGDGKVEGVDLESGAPYEATVQGDTVTLFDSEDGSLCIYTVCR